jgi:hypothetical protein
MIRSINYNINNIDIEIKKIVEDYILITYYLFSHAKIYSNSIILIL